MDKNKLAKLIDHTLLKQDATSEDVKRYCEEAVKYNFCSVITQPWYVSDVKKLLNGTGVLCGTVIGFPFGTEYIDVKEYQTMRAVKEGAQEIDMVMNISAFKNQQYKIVEDDICAVVKKAGVPVKVIIETSLLNEKEIIKACEITADGGAEFAKTSTGYFGGGATAENIKLMKKISNERIKVKASGGIRTAEDFMAMVEAGADRIGTSQAVNIICSL